jgi:WD40 repeat protein
VAPDGSWLASGGFDGQIRLWDVAEAALRGVLTGHRGSVRALAVCPDGKWLASGGADGIVRIWDVVAHTQISALVCSGPILTMSVAADGGWLAAGSYGKITIWDTGRWTTRTLLDAHAGSVMALAAAPEGDLLASVGRDRTVRIWELQHGRCEAMMRVDQDLTACSWSPDGPSLAIAGGRGRPYLFDLRLSPRR